MNDYRPAILLVDDHANTREVVSGELVEAGYRILVAEDGVRALEILEKEEEVSLILLDWHMPGMDGKSFLEHHGRNERLASIPVILCTAMESSVASPSRVKRVLRKPFSIGQLQKAIVSTLTVG